MVVDFLKFHPALNNSLEGEQQGGEQDQEWNQPGKDSGGGQFKQDGPQDSTKDTGEDEQIQALMGLLQIPAISPETAEGTGPKSSCVGGIGNDGGLPHPNQGGERDQCPPACNRVDHAGQGGCCKDQYPVINGHEGLICHKEGLSYPLEVFSFFCVNSDFFPLLNEGWNLHDHAGFQFGRFADIGDSGALQAGFGFHHGHVNRYG
jgi:hypothetical protein